MDSLKYLQHYPEATKKQVLELLREEKLAHYLKCFIQKESESIKGFGLRIA